MIKVEKHPRGIAISADDSIERNRRMRNLEVHLGFHENLGPSGRIIVPVEAAGIALDILGLDEVNWDEEILLAAKRRRNAFDLQLQARLEVARALADPLSVLTGYTRLARLDPHQLEAVAAMAVPSLRGMAIFDEQGTGKTIMALAAFDFLRHTGAINKLLVIAPKSVLATWKGECRAFLDNSYRVAILSGGATERRRALLTPHDILLVGYESAVASRQILCSIVGHQPSSYLLVVDESYFIKNPVTARSLVVSSLRASCQRAIILCGTPAPNSAIDVINQIDVADGGVTFGGIGIPKDADAAHDAISSVLKNSIFLRRLKEDVLPSIPEKQLEKVYVNLTGNQQKLYEEARTKLVLEVRRIGDKQFAHDLSNFLAKRMKLLQICSNPSMIDPLYDEIPAKVTALDHLLHELIEVSQKKVVLWSYFRKSLQFIAERYRFYGVARIDGTVVRVQDRLTAVEQFQGTTATRLFIGNAAAAGAGLTLTAAHHAIYESFSNQAAHYLQSVDRIHRRGQTQCVTSHILLARGTIEENEFLTLLRKERTAKDLLGDRPKEPITRERFLADLENDGLTI